MGTFSSFYLDSDGAEEPHHETESTQNPGIKSRKDRHMRDQNGERYVNCRAWVTPNVKAMIFGFTTKIKAMAA